MIIVTTLLFWPVVHSWSRAADFGFDFPSPLSFRAEETSTLQEEKLHQAAADWQPGSFLFRGGPFPYDLLSRLEVGRLISGEWSPIGWALSLSSKTIWMKMRWAHIHSSNNDTAKLKPLIELKVINWNPAFFCDIFDVSFHHWSLLPFIRYRLRTCTCCMCQERLGFGPVHPHPVWSRSRLVNAPQGQLQRAMHDRYLCTWELPDGCIIFLMNWIWKSKSIRQ